MSTWSNIVRGVAIGDSWGNPNEFQGIRGLTATSPQGPSLPKHLEITDDTQMTLYLGAALDDAWEGSQEDVQDSIIRNFLLYCKDPDNNRAPGATVMSSLARLKGRDNWASATSKTSDGCGTVMRATPTAFLPEDLWVGVTAFAAATTHGTANGVASAILNVAVLRDILQGRVGAGKLTEHALKLARQAALGQGPLVEVGTWIDGLEMDITEGFQFLLDILDKAVAELPTLTADPWAFDADPSTAAGMKGGWRAPDCLIAALLAADMFPTRPYLALRRAVTTDGDSDSIGAVAGGLLGALHPTCFMDLWDKENVRDRVEGRYVRWIEQEADQYPFEDLKKVGWFRKLVSK